MFFSGVEARPPKKPEKTASETGLDYSADDSGESHAANDYALVKRTRRKKVIKEKGTEKKDYGRILLHLRNCNFESSRQGN